MSEKPRSRFWQWRKYFIAALVIGLIYSWAIHPEQFWLIAGVLAGILIAVGWIAETILPFVPPKK